MMVELRTVLRTVIVRFFIFFFLIFLAAVGTKYNADIRVLLHIQLFIAFLRETFETWWRKVRKNEKCARILSVLCLFTLSCHQCMLWLRHLLKGIIVNWRRPKKAIHFFAALSFWIRSNSVRHSRRHTKTAQSLRSIWTPAAILIVICCNAAIVLIFLCSRLSILKTVVVHSANALCYSFCTSHWTHMPVDCVYHFLRRFSLCRQCALGNRFRKKCQLHACRSVEHVSDAFAYILQAPSARSVRSIVDFVYVFKLRLQQHTGN